MTLIHSLVLGIIEGLSEFLPISSTAHMILVADLLKIPSTDFSKTFEIVIQLGAILAVVILYIKKLFNWDNIKKLVVAFIPTGIIGLVLYKVVKTYLMDNLHLIVWALIIGGLILIIFEYFYKSREEGIDDIKNISYKQCLIIGTCQALAIIPGVSRSAATIVGGLALGLKRKTIVEFSFLLAVPTMLAASALDLYKNASSFSGSQFNLIAIGFISAFLAAILVIKLFIKYIQKYDFKPFGLYRILVGILFLFIL